MSLRDQAAGLMAQGAAMRREIFGECTVEFFSGKIEGNAPDYTVAGYHSSFRRALKGEVAGFLEPHDAIVRISKSAGFIPSVDKFIRVTLHDNGQSGIGPRTQFQMRITEIPHHAAGTEWRLGCKAVF